MATKMDWYQQVENERLPTNEIHETNDGKTIRIQYRESDGTIYKTTNTFEKQTCVVLLVVAERKKWKKFGDASNDPPGVNPTTTKVGDKIIMTFLTKIDDETILSVVKTITTIRCRYCKGKHFSATCPDKDRLEEIVRQPAQTTSLIKGSPSNGTDDESSMGKYIPPHKRSHGSTSNDISKQDNTTIRVSNLPEETQEQDLRDLFDRYGRITKIYLPIDKISNTPKAYAFVTFTEKKNAQMAMDCLNGSGYGYLILQIEWATNKSTNYYS